MGLPFLLVATASVLYETITAYATLFHAKLGLATIIYALIGTIGLLTTIASLSFPLFLYIREFREKIGDARRSRYELSEYRRRPEQSY